MKDYIINDRLFCPGPTPVPSHIRQEAMRGPVYHRSEDFGRDFLLCRQYLADLFQTKELPLLLTSSGTGAMEAAVANFTDPGDEVLVVVGGKFGERWLEIAKTYECKIKVVEHPWGSPPVSEQIVAALSQMKKCKALFIQLNETSTGVSYPVKEIARQVKEKSPSTLLVVDAVSGLCAEELAMDDWQLDVVLSGSQKGFGVPPGLSFIALSASAKQSFSGRAVYYFDLRRELKEQASGNSAWTPATSLISQLLAALSFLTDKGVVAINQHHSCLAEAARQGCSALGLELFAQTSPSNALTAFNVPKNLNCGKLMSTLRNSYRCTFAGGQGPLKGKIVRLAHLGLVDRFDLLSGIAALEFALNEQTFGVEIGCGVSAAMKSLASC